MRRVAASLAVVAATFVSVPAAHAEQPHIICPWTVSVLVHDVTGRYLCYA